MRARWGLWSLATVLVVSASWQLFDPSLDWSGYEALLSVLGGAGAGSWNPVSHLALFLVTASPGWLAADWLQRREDLLPALWVRGWTGRVRARAVLVRGGRFTLVLVGCLAAVLAAWVVLLSPGSRGEVPLTWPLTHLLLGTALQSMILVVGTAIVLTRTLSPLVLLLAFQVVCLLALINMGPLAWFPAGLNALRVAAPDASSVLIVLATAAGWLALGLVVLAMVTRKEAP